MTLTESLKKCNFVTYLEKQNMDAKINMQISYQQLYQLVKQLPVIEKKKLFSSLLKDGMEKPGTDSVYTHFASENALAKDWLSIEEDEAWKDL